MNKCLDFFPFGISHVLTDNGLERRSPHEHLKFKLLNVSNLLTNCSNLKQDIIAKNHLN